MNNGVFIREGIVREDALSRELSAEACPRADITRREWLERAAGLICLSPLAAVHGSGAMHPLLGPSLVTQAPPAFKFSIDEDTFLGEVEKACSLFFLHQANPYTGLVMYPSH